MKNNKYFLNTLLVAVLFLVMAVFMILRAVQPPVILLPLNIPNMVLISVIVLLAEFYLAPGNDRCYICIPVLAALTFGGWICLPAHLLEDRSGGRCGLCSCYLALHRHDRPASVRPPGEAGTHHWCSVYLSGIPVLCGNHSVSKKSPTERWGIFLAAPKKTPG